MTYLIMALVKQSKILRTKWHLQKDKMALAKGQNGTCKRYQSAVYRK